MYVREEGCRRFIDLPNYIRFDFSKTSFPKNAAIVNEIRKRQLDFSTSYEWWR